MINARYRAHMATDPQAALDRLFAAFTAHLHAVAGARDGDAPAVIDAADTLMDAFDTYDEALYDAYEVDTPFVVYDGDDDDDDWDDDVDVIDVDDDDDDDLPAVDELDEPDADR